MSTDVMRSYIDAGVSALDTMEDVSLRAREISRETLMRLIRENGDTEYGRKYGFGGIRSYEDYAGKVRSGPWISCYSVCFSAFSACMKPPAWKRPGRGCRPARASA